MQRRRIIAEGLVALLGVVLLAAAALMNRAWFQHHFLPEFLDPRARQLRALTNVRLAVAAVGLGLILIVRPWIGGLVARNPLRRLALDAAPMLLAVVLAVGAAELILDHVPWRSTQQSPPMYEPRRVWDTTFGWRQLADRTGYGVTSGRRLEYAFDVHGYRVRRQTEPVDYAKPSIIFAGESIVQGHGLTYDESAPAQLQALTGVQTANIAVGGYATDQLYLLLKSELPKFHAPVAVVVIFMPSLFHRTMDTDRPHLTRGLVWNPPAAEPRLVEIFRRLVPYRSDRDIADGVAATQDELRGIVAMARARGAVPLILDPVFGRETAEERQLRVRILDAAGLPYVQAPLDASWRLPGNLHPDARGARAMAVDVARYLAAHDVGPATGAPPAMQHASGPGRATVG